MDRHRMFAYRAGMLPLVLPLKRPPGIAGKTVLEAR
jgi:hypothetical protein